MPFSSILWVIFGPTPFKCETGVFMCSELISLFPISDFYITIYPQSFK